MKSESNKSLRETREAKTERERDREKTERQTEKREREGDLLPSYTRTISVSDCLFVAIFCLYNIGKAPNTKNQTAQCTIQQTRHRPM